MNEDLIRQILSELVKGTEEGIYHWEPAPVNHDDRHIAYTARLNPTTAMPAVIIEQGYVDCLYFALNSLKCGPFKYSQRYPIRENTTPKDICTMFYDLFIMANDGSMKINDSHLKDMLQLIKERNK